MMNQFNKISVSRLINYNKIKHNRLVDLINLQYCGSNANNINLYFDLSSLCKSLYTSNIEVYDSFELVSSIINLAGFYRQFFRRYYNVECKIYLLYSPNLPAECISIYPDYNKKNFFRYNSNKIATSFIYKALDVLSTLCPYLPDIQIYNDHVEVGCMIEFLKTLQPNYIPNIVISRDPYIYQVADENTCVLVPSKSKDVNGATIDTSILVNNISSIYYYYYKNNTIIPIEAMDIPYSYLPLLMALTRCPQRNLVSINSINKGVNIIKNINIEDIKSDKQLEIRYYLCDLKQQLESYKMSPSRVIINADIINLYNREEILNINNKYFANYPLEIESL